MQTLAMLAPAHARKSLFVEQMADEAVLREAWYRVQRGGRAGGVDGVVAVHPVLGVVGTQTIHRFNTRWSALAARCVEHLAGAVDLFPPREHPPRTYRVQIPAGEADLTFARSVRALAGP